MAGGRTSLRRDLAFLSFTALALLATFALLRACLLWRNSGLAEAIPKGEIVQAFLVGIRFDLMVTAYILTPLSLALFAPRGLGSRRLARLWLAATSAAVIFLGVVELDFYREFQTRLNSLVFQYLAEDPQTVGKMIWAGFPVVRYSLLAALLWGLFLAALGGVNRLSAPSPLTAAPGGARFAVRPLVAALALLLVVAAARGSLSPGPPLRWGDAIHSNHVFANHLALNGTFTLIKAASARGHLQLDRWWLKAGDSASALRATRDMVVVASDHLERPDSAPLQRLYTPTHAYPPGRIKNIVLIIMESFAGAYVGALGNNQGITPEFDALAARGLLFSRFFANGTHTHQGMFASVACFPNLPGHEYLMQQPEGLQDFSGLPKLFNPDSDNNVYVYNGDFRWDNQEGFFRNQGMDNFVGGDDIEQPGFVDPVWGVSDADVFRQAAAELEGLSRRGAFYAVIQTLSNHTPFALPAPLPVARVDDGDANAEHLTAMRYSDWVLGEFFRQIADQPFYRDTLFVVVGDHGFGTESILSEVNLNRFHVPLLLIAPGIRDAFGATSTTVASQVDIVPTALALLGKPFRHQCWGRDLLSLTDDPGFAVIKPSGSDQTVALVEGDRILTLSPQTPPQLGVLSFAPHLQWRPTHDRQLAGEMEHRLKSYIRTALDALGTKRTGIVREG